MGDSGVKGGDKEASYRTWRLCGIKDRLLKKMRLYIETQSLPVGGRKCSDQ